MIYDIFYAECAGNEKGGGQEITYVVCTVKKMFGQFLARKNYCAISVKSKQK